MTQEELLELVPIPKDQIFRMEGELEPEVAASRYEAQLRNHFRIEGAESPRFDVIALGLGDDGHTASIFPHTKAVHEFERLVVANYVPQKDSWRITLTWPVINQGRSVFFLISGADKAVPLQRLVEGPRDPDLQPSQLIRPANGNLVLLCDVAATANLRLQASSGLLQIGG
jgi:6-phosphogluconolactonase